MGRLYFNIVFFIIIINCYCRKPPIFDIDVSRNVFSISSELQEILLAQKTADEPLYQIGYPFISLIESNRTIEGDIKQPISISLPINNGDIDSDHFVLLYGIMNETILSHRNFSMNITKPNSIIQSHPSTNDYNESFLMINCSYNISNINYTNHSFVHPDLNNIKKIERINTLTFAQVLNKIRILTYESSFQMEDIDKYVQEPDSINLIDVSTFWVSFQRQNDAYLIISDNQKIYLYLLKFEKQNPEIILSTTITLTGIDLRKVIKFNDCLYFVTKDSSNFYFNEYNITSKLKELLKFDNQINDFVVEQVKDDFPSIYIIEQSEGLYFYENKHNTLMYPHKFMEQIDYFVNPFYGNKFLGIRTEQSNRNNEFFIEIMLPNSTTKNPKINKILVSEAKRFIPFYTLDLFHSFFFDIKSQQLYIIRRGLINIVNFLTYQIDLSFISSTPTFLSSIVDSKSKKTDALILFTNSKAYILSNITYPEHSLNCSFKEKGEYTVRLLQYSEACNTCLSLIEKNPQPYSCQKLVEYNFRIYDKTNRYLINQTGGWLIAVFLLCSIVIFTTVLLLSDCFKENLFFLIEDDRYKMKELFYDDTINLEPIVNIPNDNDNTTISKMSILYLKDTSISQHKSKKIQKEISDGSSEARLNRYQNSVNKKITINSSEETRGNIIQIRK